MALAAPFDAVRVGIVVGQTGASDAVTPNAFAAVAPVPSTADADLIAATPTQLLTTGGSGTFTLPLLAIRVTVFTASGTGNIVTLGNSGANDIYTNWPTHPSGRIVRLLRRVGGFAVSNWSSMQASNSTVTNTGLGLIVQYVARGRVVNLVGFGDSIADGRGTYIGEGFGQPAAVSLSGGAEGVAYEWTNMGWAGQSTPQIRAHVTDAIASGMFSAGGRFIAVLPAGSPNDISTTISATNITAMRGNIGRALQQLDANRVPAIVWTWLPTNTAIKACGATDALRTAYNGEVRGWASRGSVIADFDSAIAGSANGTGQVQFASGTTTDNIHPNDTGNARLTPLLVRAVQAMVLPSSGSLVR